ncbi:MAG: GntR family transcriptional regulator [Lachnospiraceae bacterium]|nr:GntR family transcriptional regulator [Lachnospiraceae bacterium]
MVENLGEEKSIYLQISEMIEDEILRDILKEEEQVPSTTELSKFYKINPATAAKGINLLVDKGILYKKRGIGMFVQEGAKSAIQKSRQESFYETYVTKIVREAKLIGITKEELSKMIKDSKEA